MNPALALALPAGLVGAAFGSWVGTAWLRRRQGEHAWHGRSRCDHCRVGLGYGQTLPLVSFALAGGRCRSCGGAIAVLHPLCELAGAVAGAALVLGLIHG
ncbi:MAG: prepilin peptidase [Caulobacteraceae bacterium]|nr:prepilin peptidase [Caulobacteraceae bacterium]